MSSSRRDVLEQELTSVRRTLDTAPANTPRELLEKYRKNLAAISDELDELLLDEENEDEM